MKGGWYCTECGELYSHPGSGLITCQRCGRLGLRGFARRPFRVTCPHDGCTWSGWDDGGINRDLDHHLHREHADLPGNGGGSDAAVS